MCSSALILVVAFVPETYYNRKHPDPPSNSGRIATLLGIHQRRVNLLRPNTITDAVVRPFKVLFKPTIFLISLYYCITFAWVVGINSESQGPSCQCVDL